MHFSNELSEKNVKKYHKGNMIENEQDLDNICHLLWEDVFLPLNIPDYFKFNVETTISATLSAFSRKYPQIVLEKKEDKSNENPDNLELFINEIDRITSNSGASPFGLLLNFSQICDFIHENRQIFSVSLYETALNSLNSRYSSKAFSYLEEALNNIKGTIRYHILQLNHTIISKTNTLVSNYFTILSNGKAACNNGWIINGNPLKDFAANSNDFHYLRRTIIIWGDLVKLRYGEKKADSPYLWRIMKEYVRKMAGIFHGFRLDNAHSTPLHVGEYLMRKARKDNRDLLIISELFTGNNELDALFSKKIGFNGLVREAQRVFIRNLVNLKGFCGF